MLDTLQVAKRRVVQEGCDYISQEVAEISQDVGKFTPESAEKQTLRVI